jgi:hypothetical protein
VLSTRAPGLPLIPKSQYQLAKLAPQVNPKLVQAGMAALGVAVVGAGTWQGYDYWKVQEARKKAALARKAPDPLLVYQQSVQALLAAPVWPASTALPSLLLEVRHHLPAYRRAGWVVDAVRCEAASAICAYSWRRENGTMASFRDSLGTQNWASVDYGVQAITTTQKVALQAASLPERSSWLDLGRYSIDERSTWTRWQDLGIKFSYAEPAVAGLPAGITEAQVSTSPVLVRAVTWKVEGAAWSRSVAGMLPPATTLQSLFLTFKSEPGGSPSMDLAAAGQIFIK